MPTATDTSPSRSFDSLLDELGAEMSAREARVGFLAIDTDHSGRIEVDEFLSWWTSR